MLRVLRIGGRSLSLGVLLLVAVGGAASAEEPGEVTAQVKVQLPGFDERVDLSPTGDGGYQLVLRPDEGEPIVLSPDQFAARVYQEQARFRWWNRLLNVTSPVGVAWVALGFLGQVLFTGRMLVQWLASERRRRSVVPPVFWWLSLLGATMLLVYFVWRKDIVGVVGQATGWWIYVRNLVLIARRRRAAGARRSVEIPEGT